MPEIYLSGDLYNYSIQKQNRKSLQISLMGPYELKLKIPRQFSLAKLEAFLQQQSTWIKQKNLCLIAARHQAPATDLSNDSLIPFMGFDYRLQISESRRKPSVMIQDKVILVNRYMLQPGSLHTLLQSWYIQQAKAYLTLRTNYWCKQFGTTVGKITIKEQKTRWGSCSSLGNINYNWRIIMAPQPTIDYLIIHEVAHRLHLNHSPQFWQLVRTHCPDYELHKAWLKNNGTHLFSILMKE